MKAVPRSLTAGLGVAMAALSALAAGSAAAADPPILVEAATAGCPTRAEVNAALEARLPGVTRARPEPSAFVRYRLELTRPAAAGEVTLRLRETRGEVALERVLAMAARAREAPGKDARGRASAAEGCQAVAEAAALVVLRYLREIGYRPPPAAPPEDDPPPPEPPAPVPPPPAAPPRSPAPPASSAPPAASLAAPPAGSPAPAPAASPPVTGLSVVDPVAGTRPRPGGSARGGGFLGLAGGGRAGLGGGGPDASGPGGGRSRGELSLAIEVSRGPWSVQLAGGIATLTTVAIPGSALPADLQLRAYPLRAAVGRPFAMLGGALAPTLGLEADLVSFSARGLQDARSGTRLLPAAAVGLGYRRDGQRFHARGSLIGAWALAARDFDAGGSRPVFRTPNAYLRLEVEVGVALWKN
jgi:hypothetical protein